MFGILQVSIVASKIGFKKEIRCRHRGQNLLPSIIQKMKRMDGKVREHKAMEKRLMCVLMGSWAFLFYFFVVAILLFIVVVGNASIFHP